jgi:hypothetical protein
MKVTIAGLDYSSALDAVHPLEVVRKLNEPSTCRLWVTLPQVPAAGLAVPERYQELIVSGDDGTVYFTGYLAVSPMPEYAGLGLAGPVFRVLLQAVSDEILLDSQMLPPSAGLTGLTAGALLQTLVARTGSTALLTGGLSEATLVGHFVPEPGSSWSRAAGQAATGSRAAYRALGGTLTLSQVGTVVHALSEGDGSLALSNLVLTAAVDRALANDVTVCGAEEPVAYVTEFFLGDGATLLFPLAAIPYFGPAASAKIIHELFNEAAIDLRNWTYTGHDGYFSLTGAGLTMNGGTGTDGQAGLVWIEPVEAGGTLLLEASGVNLSPGSTGTLAGFYSGAVLAGNCVAGFQVTAATGTGAVSVAPLVEGVAAGPAYALNSALEYTLRVRVHCPEIERITQSYLVTGDSGLEVFGGAGVVATARVQMEIEEFVAGVGGAPVVLYDGAVSYVPGAYAVAPASSLNLIGTMRSVFLTNLGSEWVVSTPPGGTAHTRRVGTLAEAAECHLEKTGSLSFYTGYAPAVGEVVAASYRTVGRAVGRAVNAASQSALAALGYPAASVWMGTVTSPAARSSHDCRNAALALVTAASSVSAAWSGTYKLLNAPWRSGLDSDVWPGDALLLTAPSITVNGSALNAQVFVRQVTLSYTSSEPEVIGYAIEFSNDWANDLSIKTSRKVPVDAWLPAAVAPTYLANLNGLAVTAITAAAVTVAANATAPAGGGFEVRRRDFSFQPGQDADLVLRSAVPNFDIPRATEADRFYIRMYDGSTPPNYSEFSAALFVNLPLTAVSL